MKKVVKIKIEEEIETINNVAPINTTFLSAKWVLVYGNISFPLQMYYLSKLINIMASGQCARQSDRQPVSHA